MSDEGHKLAAIVFTDIIGYTKQMEENEKRTMQLLQMQREIVFPIVRSYEGEIIKEMGDGLLMMFSSAVEAVHCAIAIQTRLRDEELTIRAGIQIGEVIFKEGDVFGSAVNAAARIQALASANGVCLSEEVKNKIQNHPDIRLNSIGIKTLKGIKDPMEVYEVVIQGVTKSNKKDLKYIFNDLWSRRVIQVIGIYLVGAWLIATVVSSVAKAFLLSPHLVDFSWVVLLSLVPTVFILTYYHGYRHSGRWNKAEVIGFPTNAIFTIFLIVLLFRGKDLGAATTPVTIVDENGNKTERTILKNEFRKKTIIFFFENKSGDTALNWLQYGIPYLVEYDASQDLFLEVQSAIYAFQKIKDAGYSDGIVKDLMLQKKIAGELHRTTFMSGTLNVKDGKYTVDTKLFNAQTGKLLIENQFLDLDIFQLVDKLTVQLKRDLGIPESHIDETADLPVSEISTSSFDAMKHFIDGIIEANFNHNIDKGIQQAKNAIAIDKEFLLPYMLLYQGYMLNNQSIETEQALSVCMEKSYKLPERLQYQVKSDYFFISKQSDKALLTCQTWANLFPDDIAAHKLLIMYYGMRAENDKAIRECKTILSIDPEQFDFFSMLGQLYEQEAKYDSSEYYYKLYLKAYPKNIEPYMILGEFYKKTGEFDKASQSFKNALVLEPTKISLMLTMADIDIRKGHFGGADSVYTAALANSKSPQDSATVYAELKNYFFLRGELSRSIAVFHEMMNKLARFGNPLYLSMAYSNNANIYVQAGRPDEAFELLKKSEQQLGPPFNNLVSIGFLSYYVESGQADEAEKYIPKVLQAINELGMNVLMTEIIHARGRIAEMRDDYKTALENYTEYLQKDPTSYDACRWISRCQRELGDLKEAEKSIEQALKQHPYDPENNYEAGMLYLKMNEKEKAREYLDRALEVWKNADASYKPYQKALEARKQLETV